MTDHATLALSIRPGAPIVEETADSLTFKAPETGALTLKPLGPGLTSALRSLTAGYTTEEQLTAMVMTAEGVQALVSLHQNLARLSGRGLLCHRLQVEGQPFAEVIPIARYYTYRPRMAQAEKAYQVSRFAYMRHVDGRMVAESPRGFAQVVLHDPRAAWLVAEFARPHTCCNLATTHPDLPVHVIESFANLLLNAEILAPVDETGRAPEDTALALVPWEFHDLLFHSRTRAGRHANPYGGTFRFRGKVDPPPMVKPPMSEDAIDLYKPDVDELRRTDPTFAAVLESRKSVRDYGEQPITDRQLGEFLYRTARIKHVVRHGPAEMEFGLRNYPGGGAIHELEIYPVIGACQNIPAGLYHYRPLEHRLCRIADRKTYVDALLRVAWITADRHSEPQVLFVITARYQRVTWKYQSMAYALHLKNLGILYQTMYLVATAMGLAPCALGGGDSDLFAHASGLDYYTESSIGEFMLGSKASLLMTQESSKALVQLYYQALNQDRLEMLDACVAPGFAHHLQGVPEGWASLKRVLRQYRLGFRDLTSRVQMVLIDGDHVTAHLLTHGTHTGDFLGHPPTGRSFAAPGIEIFRVEAGCLMERWGVFDTLTMLHQLGLFQPAGAYRLQG